MDMIYIVFSFVTFFAAILLIFAFKNDFKKLNTFQKVSLSLIIISALLPTILGFINGFLTAI